MNCVSAMSCLRNGSRAPVSLGTVGVDGRQNSLPDVEHSGIRIIKLTLHALLSTPWWTAWRRLLSAGWQSRTMSLCIRCFHCWCFSMTDRQTDAVTADAFSSRIRGRTVVNNAHSTCMIVLTVRTLAAVCNPCRIFSTNEGFSTCYRVLIDVFWYL